MNDILVVAAILGSGLVLLGFIRFCELVRR